MVFVALRGGVGFRGRPKPAPFARVWNMAAKVWLILWGVWKAIGRCVEAGLRYSTSDRCSTVRSEVSRRGDTGTQTVAVRCRSGSLVAR